MSANTIKARVQECGAMRMVQGLSVGIPAGVGAGAAVGVAFANLAFWLGVGVVAGNLAGVGLAYWLRRHE
jgi:hypothetical protein